MSELKNHPGFHLRDDAAAQFDLYEELCGSVSVNRAAVSEAEQQKLIDRWNAGGKFNRPPYLYEPKRPARASAHVQEIAVDTSHVSRMLAEAEPFGFYQRYAWDKPHFEFDPTRVRIRRGNTVSPPAPSKKRKLAMHEALLQYTPTNKLLIVNLKDKTIIDLGSDPNSGLRKYYANNHPWTPIGEADWQKTFGRVINGKPEYTYI